MKRVRLLIGCLLFLVFVELFLHYQEASAQMQVVYPRRLSFYGLVELTYKNYQYEFNSGGRQRETSYSTFRQRYTLGLKGYIYDPRLIVFSSKITFIDDNTIDTTSPFKPESKNWIYELSAVFLPYRPVSLQTYFMRSDYAFEGLNGSSPYDQVINNYGAILGVNLRKYPEIRFEYYHLDITPTGSQRNKKGSTNDAYYLTIRGAWSKLKTQYTLSFGLTEIDTVLSNRQIKFADIYTHTSLKRFSLINFFRYYDADTSKLFGVYSNLLFTQEYRFYHSYYYSYEHSESTSSDDITTERDRQDLRGFFSYRLRHNLFSSLSLNYGVVKEEESKWNYHAVSATINYSRPIKNTYLVSFYRFILKDDELKGKFTEHTISLDLTTRQLKWGRIYASYYFTYLDGTFKFKLLQEFDEFDQQQELAEGTYKTLTHSFVIGTQGRAFRRATWNLEAQYINSNSTKKRPKISFNSDDEFSGDNILKTEFDRNYFVLLGEMMYPFGRRGAMLTLRAGSNFGDINSQKTSKIYYQLRLNYPISRRFRFLALWRQSWYTIERNPDRNVNEFDLIADYRLGKLYLNGELWILNEQENSRERTDRRLILKATRYF